MLVLEMNDAERWAGGSHTYGWAEEVVDAARVDSGQAHTRHQGQLHTRLNTYVYIHVESGMGLHMESRSSTPEINPALVHSMAFCS